MGKEALLFLRSCLEGRRAQDVETLANCLTASTISSKSPFNRRYSYFLWDSILSQMRISELVCTGKWSPYASDWFETCSCLARAVSSHWFDVARNPQHFTAKAWAKGVDLPSINASALHFESLHSPFLHFAIRRQARWWWPSACPPTLHAVHRRICMPTRVYVSSGKWARKASSARLPRRAKVPHTTSCAGSQGSLDLLGSWKLSLTKKQAC